MEEFGLCETPDILRIISFIKVLIDIVRFIVPMGLIVMVSLDVGKGVISGENEIGKVLKANGNRFLAAAVIFLLPTIVNFVLVFVDETTSYESCWANAESSIIEEYQVLWDEAKKKEEEQVFITSSSDITFSYKYYEYKESSNALPYALYTPSSASTNKTTPLIVWLHGSGEVGSIEANFKSGGIYKVFENWNLYGFNAYVLCPHLPSGVWYTEDMKSKVFKLIDYIIEEKNINKERIILSGHSLGGQGALYMGYHKMEYFSSLVVMSGYEPGVDIAKITIPTIGYNGSLDSDYMFNDFIKVFGENNLFVLDGVHHGQVPNVAFTTDGNHDNKSDLIEWMLTTE